MKRSRLPKSLTTITPFSKMLALSMFILFPIIGFFLGIQYERSQSSLIFRTYYKDVRNSVKALQGTQCSTDTKACSDGSLVKRSGVDCTFAACPGEN